MANRMANVKQHTVAWHVDDLNSSHVDPKVNDYFHVRLDKTYGSDDIGHVEESCGKLHEYLAMNLYYTEEVELKIDIWKYLDAIISKFPHKLSDNLKFPWIGKMFELDE